MKFEVRNYILLKYKWSSFAFQLCFKLGSLVRCFLFVCLFVFCEERVSLVKSKT